MERRIEEDEKEEVNIRVKKICITARSQQRD